MSCRAYGSFLFPGKGAGAPWNKANVTVDAICGGLGAAAGAHARSAGFLRPFQVSVTWTHFHTRPNKEQREKSEASGMIVETHPGCQALQRL